MVKSHPRIFTYVVQLPDGINEAVMACAEGYTIYIDEDLDEAGRKRAFQHAMIHIGRSDFYRGDVQRIEAEAHRKE